jgi:hypothetical protein
MGQSSVRLSADEFHQRIVEFDSVICNSDTMLHAISNTIDIAVHPMLMDSDCDGCVWTYLSSNGLVMVSGWRASDRTSIPPIHLAGMVRHCRNDEPSY